MRRTFTPNSSLDSEVDLHASDLENAILESIESVYQRSLYEEYHRQRLPFGAKLQVQRRKHSE